MVTRLRLPSLAWRRADLGLDTRRDGGENGHERQHRGVEGRVAEEGQELTRNAGPARRRKPPDGAPRLLKGGDEGARSSPPRAAGSGRPAPTFNKVGKAVTSPLGTRPRVREHELVSIPIGVAPSSTISSASTSAPEGSKCGSSCVSECSSLTALRWTRATCPATSGTSHTRLLYGRPDGRCRVHQLPYGAPAAPPRAGVVVLDSVASGYPEAVGDVPLVLGNVADDRLVASIVAEHDGDAVAHFVEYKAAGESMVHPCFRPRGCPSSDGG